jgi:S-DNA-T family DNA segregation ATPase FtsK/SpoIIIE
MADLARMPHTLVAGSTGSGKSVCMNAIITGLIMTKTPLELRLIMIDPKRVELTPYQGIPHLYHPVIVEADRAVVVLKSLVDEMMGRFRMLEQASVKNIASYNEKVSEKMPYLVILVDELADLMLTSAGEVERLLVRLAQLGRATGVHLVVATQRPSVDVVTGLIKANFPSRISFAVMSQIDSRTILDSAGAEKLLGRGDMLYMPIDKPKPSRVQGAFLNDHEIEGVVSAWQSLVAPPLPELVVSFDDAGAENGTSSSAVDGDSLFDQAANLAQSQKTLSVSLLQRRLRIGYPRAARLMDELEDEGVVGAGEPGKPRPVI